MNLIGKGMLEKNTEFPEKKLGHIKLFLILSKEFSYTDVGGLRVVVQRPLLPIASNNHKSPCVGIERIGV